jgi:division protein CdvB (Snf7/Vps24/ESCRT-III family)
MKIAMNHLIFLKEELDDIQETEGEMSAVMPEHIYALQKILESAKKPVRLSSYVKLFSS